MYALFLYNYQANSLTIEENDDRVHQMLIIPNQLQLEITRIPETIPVRYILPGKHTKTK